MSSPETSIIFPPSNQKTQSRFFKGASKLDQALARLGVNDNVEIYPENLSGTDKRVTKTFEHNSTFVTCTHFAKAMFSPTIFVMPFGFMCGGLTFTIFVFLAVVILSAYSMKRLCDSADYLSQREEKLVRTYDEVAYVSFYTCTDSTRRFANTTKFLVNCLFFLTYLDACTVLMIFVAQNIRSMVTYHFPDAFINVHHYLFIQVIFLMAMSSIRDLKYLTPFSFISAFLLAVAVLLICIFYFLNDIPNPLDRNQINSMRDIFRSICVSVFCVSGVTISLTMKSSMTKPRYFFAFPGIYVSSMAFHCFTYIPFGYLGYLKYGSETLPSVILNLGCESFLSFFIKFSALFAILLASPIVFYVAFNVIWTNYIKYFFHVHNILLLEFLLRYLLIILSCILAQLFPNVNSKIILRGALCNVHLEITIPAILDFVTFYPEKGSGRFHCRLFRLIFFTIIGVVICFVGLFFELTAN